MNTLVHYLGQLDFGESLGDQLKENAVSERSGRARTKSLTASSVANPPAPSAPSPP